MEIIPIRAPSRRNLGTSCMTRTIRDGPKGMEICGKSLLLPSDQPSECPKRVCAKCQPGKGTKHITCQYIQPPRTKNFAPLNVYHRPTDCMDNGTIYRKSYMPVDGDRPDLIFPQNNLGIPKGKFATNTVQKMSFPGWYNPEKSDQIKPCHHDLLGKGPISNETTARHDYTEKLSSPACPVFPTNNLFLSNAPFANNTVNKMSYMPVDTCQKRDPYMQAGTMEWPTGPLDGKTTHNMSYLPCKVPRKEYYPWAQKKKYEAPTTKMTDDTIYRKSYIPNPGWEKTELILPKQNSNFLGENNNFDSGTIYHMSYPGNLGFHRPDQFSPINNLQLSKQRMDGKTTQNMSYIPNPGHVPTETMRPCNHNLLGTGPMEDITTNRHDYVAKEMDKATPFRPKAQITLSADPLSDKTINRLSFMPPDMSDVMDKIIPPNQIKMPTGKMENRTTQKMSYMPVGPLEPVSMPWKDKKPYCTPTNRFSDDTCYRMSYDAPGEWVNCDNGASGGSCECDCVEQDCPCPCPPCPNVPIC